MKREIKYFIAYLLVWISQNLSIPFWVIGHVHLSVNVYEDLHEIIKIIVKHKITFPKKDTSDLIEFVKDKKSFHYPKFTFNDKEIIAPFTNSNEPFIRLICFMKSYASHTFKYNTNFKDHFKKVFNIFYSMNV